MNLLFTLLITAGIYGMINFWESDRKKRNISAIITIISLVAFFVFTVNKEEQATDLDETEEIKKVVNNPSYEYEIDKQYIKKEEISSTDDFEGLFVHAITDEKLNKEQIKRLLNKIKEDTEYDRNEEDLYILLFENEIIAEGRYSLGRLMYLEDEIEIDAREKDWSKQPREKEYEVYNRYLTIAEAEEGLTTDEKLADKTAEAEDIDRELVLEIVKKVQSFIISDESVE